MRPGLSLGGDNNGRFHAFDQETGEVLWEINLGSAASNVGVTGGCGKCPEVFSRAISDQVYAVDGRQYIAIGTGTASTASLFGRLTPEIRPSTTNNLFVSGWWRADVAE